jgi:uncharacterized metal-binding protein
LELLPSSPISTTGTALSLDPPAASSMTLSFTFAVVLFGQDLDVSKKSFAGQMQRWHAAAKYIQILRIIACKYASVENEFKYVSPQ